MSHDGMPAADEQPYLDRHFLVRDGLKLHYRDYPGSGDKPPLLCLPGLTRNARDFVAFAELHSPEFRVFALELALDVSSTFRGELAEIAIEGQSPDGKTHKIPALTKKQMEAGAIGITCQKLGEVEGMASGRLPDPAHPRVAPASQVDLTVVRADLAQVLAMIPGAPRAVTGTGTVAVRGRLTPELRLSAELDVPTGRVENLPLADLRVPAEVTFQPSARAGVIR